VLSRRFIGISLIVFAAAALAIYLIAQPQIIHFLEISISADGEIKPDGVRQVSYLVFLFSILVGVLGAILLKSGDESWRKQMM
jgi:hypothetical protein